MSDGCYFEFLAQLAAALVEPETVAAVDAIARELAQVRERGGRLFVLGVGGGAANAAHAANDLRKLCGIEAYAPTDSVAELTARANDEGWATIFTEWLEVSRWREGDALLVFSVGGGTAGVSSCIFHAVSRAKGRGVRVLGVVGRREGMTAQEGDAVVVADCDRAWLTPVTETLQVAVLHALVSDPRLKRRETKW